MIPYDFSLLTPMKPGVPIPQNTQEWLDARRGRITASKRAFTLVTGRPATIARMMDEMAKELHQPAVESFAGHAAQHGRTYEVPAIRNYLLERLGADPVVINPGMFVHPEFDIASATPDFFEGDHTTGQVKCPQVLENHLRFYEFGVKVVDYSYYVQVQFESFVTGRKRIVFVSYHPDARPVQKLHYEIVPVDESMHQRFHERLTMIHHMLVNNERPSYEQEFDGVPDLF